MPDQKTGPPRAPLMSAAGLALPAKHSLNPGAEQTLSKFQGAAELLFREHLLYEVHIFLSFRTSLPEKPQDSRQDRQPVKPHGERVQASAPQQCRASHHRPHRPSHPPRPALGRLAISHAGPSQHVCKRHAHQTCYDPKHPKTRRHILTLPLLAAAANLPIIPRGNH